MINYTIMIKQIYALIYSLLILIGTLSAQDLKIINTLEKSGHSIVAIAISPDGKQIATAGTDNEILLWDLSSGTVVNTLKGHTNWILGLNYSPNGHYLVSGSKDNTAKIWDIRSGAEITALKGHSGTVATVIYSNDGKYIATGSADATAKIWDAASGILLKTLGGHTKEVTAIAFNPDATQLVSTGADMQLKVWDVLAGNLLKTGAAHDKYVRSIAFSPDGKYIATGGDDKLIKLWDAKTVNLSKTIKGHGNWVQSLHFSPDGKYLASGAHDNTAYIWNVETGAEALNLKKHGNIIYDIEFSHDGKFIAVCELSKVKTYDIQSLNIKPLEKETKSNLPIAGNKGMDIDFDPGAAGKNYLLIIGVSQYKYWPQLGNAVRDAKDVKRVLTTRYTFDAANVIEVYDQEATVEGMYKAFNALKDKLKPNDNLLIYFSGHGFYNKGFDEGYWIPVDAQKGKETDYLPNSTLLKYLKALETKHTFLVADACFSGSLFSDGHRGYIENVESVRSRWGLTSGRLEYVSDGTAGKNSPFATYVIKFLETNQKKRFAVSELIQYVKVSVANNSEQTPIGNPLRNVGDEGGEFVFYLK
jgi:WD40 repeat protein